MFLIISCDQNQLKSTVIFHHKSTSLWQDQCLGTVRWTFLIELTKINWKEDKKFLKKSSTEMLILTCLRVFREWSKDKINFLKNEQQNVLIRHELLETAPLRQRFHTGSRISRQSMNIFTLILKTRKTIRSQSSSSLSLLKIAQRNHEPLMSKRRLNKAEESLLTQNTKKLRINKISPTSPRRKSSKL